MSTPLVPFHNALYTTLDAISGLTAYSFVPDAPSFPYVYIERKQCRPQDTNRTRVRYAIRNKLIVVTNDKDINALAGWVDEIEDALSGGLTLVGTWATRIYRTVPDSDIFPITNFDGSQGHAAEVFHDFIIESTS